MILKFNAKLHPPTCALWFQAPLAAITYAHLDLRSVCSSLEQRQVRPLAAPLPLLGTLCRLNWSRKIWLFLIIFYFLFKWMTGSEADSVGNCLCFWLFPFCTGFMHLLIIAFNLYHSLCLFCICFILWRLKLHVQTLLSWLGRWLNKGYIKYRWKTQSTYFLQASAMEEAHLNLPTFADCSRRCRFFSLF